MRQFVFALLMLVVQLAPASAQDQWREFRADADGFVVSSCRRIRR